MTAVCAHCGQDCRLTNGCEVYPHRPDLAGLRFWVCDPCDARVGCHKPNAKTDNGTSDGSLPLGRPANAELRRARNLLHGKLDPIWQNLPKKDRWAGRRRTYRVIARHMGLTVEQTHVAMFDLEQCRKAWLALDGVNTKTVLDIGKYDPSIDRDREAQREEAG